MNKMIGMGLVIGVIGLIYMSNSRTVITDDDESAPDKHMVLRVAQGPSTWQEPQDGQFNEIRAVCLPRDIVLRTGAASDMRDNAKADRTMNQYALDPLGKQQLFYCYIKFFYNPNKKAVARQRCDLGRQRPEPGEFDLSYSTMNGIPCHIQFGELTNFRNKITNPVNDPDTLITDNVAEAINYLKTGGLAQAPELTRAPGYEE